MNKLTLSALAALALTAMPARAGNLYWNGVGASPDAGGGNGTWNAALTNWQNAPTGGSATAWVNANNDTAFFGNTAGTVSLGTGITVGGLQFDTAGYVVQSNTLTFGVSGNIVTNTDATINSALAATSLLTITKTGNGTLTLGGANGYAGNTTVSSGTLKAGSTTALSANSTFSIATGATLDLGGFNNTIKSPTTNTGTITNSTGNATLTLTNVFGGGTSQLFTGSLALKWNGTQGYSSVLTNASNTFSGGITIGGGTGNTRFLVSGTIGSGTPGALTSGIWGTGALTLGVTAADYAQILFAGGTTINNAIVVNSALGNSDAAGTFRVDSTGNVFNGTLTANLANATFRNNGGLGAVTVNGAISGASGLMLSASAGSGLTITLANTGTANSYVGDTTISSVKETLTLGAANQLPNGTGKGNLIVTGGTFNMGGFSETINGLSGTGTVDGVSGTPTLTVGDNDATGASNTFSGSIKNTAGTLALTKTGSGTLTLSGNNTYGGATTVSVGTLKAGSTTGLSANSSFSVGTGATLDLGGFNNSIKSLSTATGTITDSSGSGLGGTLKIATAMPGGTSAQLFTGSMGLQIFGGNTVDTILSNTANTYSGGTILGDGSGGGPNTRILLGAGTLGAGAPGAVTSGIFGTGAISIGAAAGDKSQLYFQLAITINNAIVVNTEAGTDQPGAFRVENNGSILAGALNANLADARFHSFGSGTISVTGAISGNSGLALSTTFGTLGVTLNNAGIANSYAGNTTIGTANSSLTLGRADQISNGVGKGNLIITGGTFNMGGFSETINGLSGNGTVDGISGTPTLTVGDNNATSTFSGVIKNTAGALALTKTGNGTLTLSNTNTYSGATLVSTGTLLVNGSTSASSAVNVSSGARLGGNGTVGGSLTVASGATLAPGNSPGILSSGNLSLSGILSMEINGVTVGTQYDQVNVTGTVSLVSGNTLTLSLGYTPTNGTNFFLINNDFSDAIVGTLNGFAQNATFTLASQLWKISYTGDSGTNSFSGSGNDLVIQAIPEPATWALLAFSLTTVMVLRRRRQS
ncbi:MAG: autotransporter-associated beta strand repeat-containing protein [Verrucomicrobia bacterium]|nr:autotransporter-associated beta strand repeat-containing protein [Verrucomicrobiota bacterium]